ncbi:Uncharacterised protein [Mycobacteroides abscessus subsp. abscessus]|nr:Uncharacterised protein [Mycobacteroides abscessus subsp. abscessus]
MVRGQHDESVARLIRQIHRCARVEVGGQGGRVTLPGHVEQFMGQRCDLLGNAGLMFGFPRLVFRVVTVRFHRCHSVQSSGVRGPHRPANPRRHL